MSDGSGLLFVVGSRRSGTLWLHRILASHPEVAALPSETHLFSHGIAPLFDRFQHGPTGSTLTGRIHADRATLLARTRDLCDAVLEPYRQGAAYLLERTPLHIRELELIREIYPAARMIQIIRDGRDVARSLAVQGWGPETITDAAIEWRDSVQAGRDANQPADLYREIRYEELLADPEAQTRELLGWLDLDAGAETIAGAIRESRAKANVGPERGGNGSEKWRQEWTGAEIEEFEAAAGDLLRALGYRTGSAVAPSPRPNPDSTLRQLGGRARDRIRRLATAAATVDETHLGQLLADEFVAALLGGSTDTLDELLWPNASVELIEPSGRRKARGAEAQALLAELTSQDPAFSSTQLEGETRIGTPWSTTILRFGGPDGAPLTRIVCTSARGERIEDVAIYRLD